MTTPIRTPTGRALFRLMSQRTAKVTRATVAAIEAEAIPIPVLDALEAARLVAQWHGAIGSGPIEVLDAELGELGEKVQTALASPVPSDRPEPIDGELGRNVRRLAEGLGPDYRLGLVRSGSGWRLVLLAPDSGTPIAVADGTSLDDVFAPPAAYRTEPGETTDE